MKERKAVTWFTELGLSSVEFYRLVTGEDPPKSGLQILSLGAGLQSSVIGLMACHGEIEKPHAAIFADPQWESAATYEWLTVLDEILLKHGIPLIVVSIGSLPGALVSSARAERERRAQEGRGEDVTTERVWAAPPPLYTVSLRERGCKWPKQIEGQLTLLDVPAADAADDSGDPNGKIRKPMMIDVLGTLGRNCTRTYKIEPIQRAALQLMGFKRASPRRPVTQLLGITTDEAGRMRKPKSKAWINSYPLIDKGMSRGDCAAWLDHHGYKPIPKSSCLGCPFKSNRSLAEDRREDPEAFEATCQVDDEIREGIAGTKAQGLYLHRSARPLRDVYLDDNNESLFDIDCQGVCGV